MASFEKALPFVLSNEGSWADDPDDPGGATMAGITFAVAQKHGIRTKEELKNISPRLVQTIYRADYWRFDALEDQAIATKVFDLCVNMGVKAGVRLLQQCCGAEPDGVFGPKTAAAANSVDPGVLMPALIEAAKQRYLDIATNRDASKKYLAGWFRRADRVPEP